MPILPLLTFNTLHSDPTVLNKTATLWIPSCNTNRPFNNGQHRNTMCSYNTMCSFGDYHLFTWHQNQLNCCILQLLLSLGKFVQATPLYCSQLGVSWGWPIYAGSTVVCTRIEGILNSTPQTTIHIHWHPGSRTYRTIAQQIHPVSLTSFSVNEIL